MLVKYELGSLQNLVPFFGDSFANGLNHCAP